MKISILTLNLTLFRQLRGCDNHHFCKRCLEQLLDMPNRLRTCPVCHTSFEGREDFMPANRLFKNNIDLFELKCENYKNGCGLRFSLRNIFDHEKECPYTTGKMTKCLNCDQWMEGSQINSHDCIKASSKRIVWQLVT
jgi:hypothetical protein